MNKVDFSASFYDNNSFRRYCLGLSKEQIQNMTTRDWLLFYDKVGSLCGHLDTSPHKFVKTNADVFAHMYQNYRSPQAVNRKIKELAYNVADKLSESEEFSSIYYRFDVTCNRKKIKKAAKIMRRAVYDVALKNAILSTLMMPKIKIKKSDEIEHAGTFCKNDPLDLPVVNIRNVCVDFCNVTAHELFHSLQNLPYTTRALLLRKFNINLSSDKEIEALYKLNRSCYLEAKEDYQGYRKQPLEWGARFFATCFERRLRKNLKAEENNWNLLYQTIQVVRELEINDNKVLFDKKGIEVIVDISNKRDESVLMELKKKYIKSGYIMICGSFASLRINRDTQTFMNISNLYNKEQKNKREGIGKEEFIKQFFPITYDTFYRTEKEKRVQSSVLDKIRINRSR